MKTFAFSLMFVLCVAAGAHALTTVKGGVNVMPEPLPESSGQLIYEEMGCPICHGHQGGGDGFLAEGLTPKPRDFTDFEVMSRLSDMTMFESIKNGIPNSAMPAWNLTDEQIFDVISYIKTFLAESQTTIGVCFNEQKEIDIRNLELGRDYKVGVDKQHLLKVASRGDRIQVEPRDMNVLRYFKETGRKLVRTHVRVARNGSNESKALIVVRIRDCLK